MAKSIEALRAAAREVIASHDTLLEAWRRLEPSDYGELSNSSDIHLLRELVKRRVYPINAFAVLAHVDKEAAIEMLLSRYVGEKVDPDKKFGGYSFELETMVSDLLESHGESALRDLIQHPSFNKSRLQDGRVIEAFSDALDIAPEKFARWLQSVG